MLKMAVVKHHATYNDITNSMDEMLHIIIPFILPNSFQWAQSAMVQLRWIWARRKRTFFTIVSGMSEWKVVEASGLKRNDRDIFKFAFDVLFLLFVVDVEEICQNDQFWKLVKTLDGMRALIFF